jgi:hypothetical protein
MCAEAVKAEEANANANMNSALQAVAPQAPVLTTLDVNTPIDGGSNRKRAVQHVSTRATRKAVVRWMIEDEAVNGKKLLISRAVKAFPEHFFGADKSNLQKASCWWKRREEILEDDDDEHDPEVTCRVRVSSRGSLKARAGRGRKRAARIIRAPVLGVLDAKRARRGRVTNHGSKNGKRALQHVSTMATRKVVVSCSGRIAKRLLELASRGSEFLGLAEQLWASGVVWNRKRIVKIRAGRRRSRRTSRG